MFSTDIKSLIHLTRTFPNQEACIKYLEQIMWDGTPVSPFDETSRVYKCKAGRYKCKNTGKYFNVMTGTMYEATKLELQTWFVAIWLLTVHKKGISSYQLARDLDISQNTAWFLAQRIRSCFHIENNNELEGTVEIDETFIGGKNKNRHANKKVKYSEGRSYADKVPVVGMLQRNGKITAVVVNNTQKNTLQPLVRKYVKPQSQIITDEWQAYKGLGTDYTHNVVNHAGRQYVNNEDSSIHSNGIESAWKVLKNSVGGMYNHVSRKHLQLYVDEFVYRFNMRKLEDSDKFNWILLNSRTRTRYRDLSSKTVQFSQVQKKVVVPNGKKFMEP